MYESLPLSYEVRARANPEPEAHWTHDGKYIKEEAGRVSITHTGDSYKLVFKEVKMEDMGEIKVMIQNKLGEQAQQGFLKVIRKTIFDWFLFK